MRHMKSATVKQHFFYLIVFASAITFTTTAKANNFHFAYADTSIVGRWDITIDMAGKQVPSWLEVRHSGVRTSVSYTHLTLPTILRV